MIWNALQELGGLKQSLKNKFTSRSARKRSGTWPPSHWDGESSNNQTNESTQNSDNTQANHPSTAPTSPIDPAASNRSFAHAPSEPGGGPSSQDGVLAGGNRVPSFDLTIQFISARDIPKTDPTGKSDPYFKAELDEKIGYTSTAQKQTLTPTWNETWNIKNVPGDAILRVKLYDKDENILRDDYIGDFYLPIGDGGETEHDILGRMGKKHGTFKLKITTRPIEKETKVAPYTFGGPCRYSRHKSPTIGALTARQTDERLYATWKIYLTGIPEFFGDTHQPWNKNYSAAKKIFDHNPLSATIRSTIHAGHKILYARTTANAFGLLGQSEDLIKLFRDESTDNRIKPCIYTYIINDDTWRFSETGAAFFVDFVSKHALHADVATQVRYSGEFHWRPMVEGHWAGFHESHPSDDDSVQWELVIDNNSGTYSPDKTLLPKLKGLIEYNFPGLNVAALDHSDPELKKSTEALHNYAKEYRGISAHEFTAHEHLGSTTMKNVAAKLHIPIGKKDLNGKQGDTGHQEEKKDVPQDNQG